MSRNRRLIVISMSDWCNEIVGIISTLNHAGAVDHRFLSCLVLDYFSYMGDDTAFAIEQIETTFEGLVSHEESDLLVGVLLKGIRIVATTMHQNKIHDGLLNVPIELGAVDMNLYGDWIVEVMS